MSQKPEFLAEIERRRTALRTQLAELLPRPRPIVWEIGCGHGHFLVGYAQENPAKFCIGVDLRLDRLARSAKKLGRAQLPNCRFVRSEAREFLHSLPEAVTFEEVWVLFPDPWPKARHHKNRLLKPELFAAIAARAGEGARFFFRTDHAEYFAEVSALLEINPFWRPVTSTPWPLELATVFQSRAPQYHSLIAVRTRHPAKPVFPVAPGLPAPAAPRSPA